MRCWIAAVALFIAGASGGAAWAATVEVSPGEDWCDIVNAHGAGDEIVLLGGEHQGPCWIQADGVAGDPLVVRGEGGATPTQIVYAGAGDNVVNVYSEHLVLRGLAFGPTQPGIDAIQIREGGDIAVEACTFHQVGGISVAANSTSTYDLAVRDSVFTDLQSTGMYFGCHAGAGDCATNVVIEGNLIDGVDSPNGIGYGLEVKVDSRAEVRDNVIHDTKGPGIAIYGSYDEGIVSLVERNLVIGSRNNGTIEIAGGPCIARGNIAVGGAFGAIYVSDYQDRGLQRGVHVIGNTAYDAEPNALVIQDWVAGNDLVLANNAAFLEGGQAISDEVGGVTWTGNVSCASAADCWVDAAAWDFWPAAGSPLCSEGAAPSGGWVAGLDFCMQIRGSTPHVGALEGTAGEDGPGPLTVAAKATFACPEGGGDDDGGDDDAGDDDAGDDDVGDDDFGDDDTAGDDDAGPPTDDCDCTHVPRRLGSVEAVFGAVTLAAGLALWNRRRRRS